MFYTMDDIRYNIMGEYLFVLFSTNDIVDRAKEQKRIINQSINNLFYRFNGTGKSLLKMHKLIRESIKIKSKLKCFNKQMRQNKIAQSYHLHKNRLSKHHHSIGDSEEFTPALLGVSYAESEYFLCLCCQNPCLTVNHVECKYCNLFICTYCSQSASKRCVFCAYEIKEGIRLK